MSKDQCGKDCPYSKFEPFDLRVSSYGNYECPLKGQDFDQYGSVNGYVVCDEESHKECSLYLEQSKLEKEVLKNEQEK
jgi:hypothetical protein